MELPEELIRVKRDPLKQRVHGMLMYKPDKEADRLLRRLSQVNHIRQQRKLRTVSIDDLQF